MYIPDTDIVSLLLHQRDTPLATRVRSAVPEQLWISTITVEQVLGGAWKIVNNPARAEEGCALLRQVMTNLSWFQILPFDAAAKRIFDGMSAEVKRIGTADCKIASIAISRGFTVITRDADVGQMRPTVKTEDWTIDRR